MRSLREWHDMILLSPQTCREAIYVITLWIWVISPDMTCTLLYCHLNSRPFASHSISRNSLGKNTATVVCLYTLKPPFSLIPNHFGVSSTLSRCREEGNTATKRGRRGRRVQHDMQKERNNAATPIYESVNKSFSEQADNSMHYLYWSAALSRVFNEMYLNRDTILCELLDHSQPSKLHSMQKPAWHFLQIWQLRF